MLKFKVEGMKELQKALKKLGEVPQKHVTASVKKAMNTPLRVAKRTIPPNNRTGNLKKGLISVGEKVSAKKKGKKVYRIVFDKKMNNVFQKPAKKQGKGGYYPVSQEYGFFTAEGKFHSKRGRKIEGTEFIRKALTISKKDIEKTIVDTMKKKIDNEIAKGGLKK